MNLQNVKLAVWFLPILGALALFANVVVADGGEGLLFEETKPSELEQVADSPAPDSDPTMAQGVGPAIDIWYGTSQVFGQHGNPQRWISILGRVSDGDGVKSLKYSLNGGQQEALSIGPDGRRLASKGDFNVEIHRDRLRSGLNNVLLTARDKQGNRSSKTVALRYEEGNVWPVPYAIDWSKVSDIQDAAQVVDGLWEISPGGIRTTVRGYDRLLAIGDVTWTDYEVTVPFTVHSRGKSGAPGVGILMRWKGHTDDPVPGWQPNSGWYPLGALGWYRWYDSGARKFHIYGNQKRLLASTSNLKLRLNKRYLMKMRVETTPGQGSIYRLKMWRAGKAEPAGWTLKGKDSRNAPLNGSLLLVAHQVDVTFGDVQVRPVGRQHALDTGVEGEGRVSMETDSGAYAGSERIRLTPLLADGWVFEGWSGSDAGDLVDNGDGTWSLEMDKDRSVAATFGTGCHSLSVSTVPAGTGSVQSSPPPNCGSGGYTTGTQVHLLADPGPGYVLGHWSGSLSGRAGEAVLDVTGDMFVTANFLSSALVYEEGFEGYELGTDPDGWHDTGARNSMSQDDSLFQVYTLDENRVFGTQSTRSNIHSHYVGPGSQGWTSYRFMGRMMISEAAGGIGVTIYSKYPDRDAYYRLRRHGTGTFRLAPHPHRILTLKGDTDTGVKPQPNVWYWFVMEVQPGAKDTEIRVKVWADGTPEPEGWQAVAHHRGRRQLPSGRIGVWSYAEGSKYWDDILVAGY